MSLLFTWLIFHLIPKLFASKSFEILLPSLDEVMPRYLNNDLFPFLNAYNLTEPGYDIDSKFILKIFFPDNSNVTKPIEFDLNFKLFEAAIAEANIPRIEQLLNLKKHLDLSTDLKSTVLFVAMESLSDSKDILSTYEIIKLLLAFGFYPETGFFPISSCPFYQVIKDPEASRIFLDYDPHIFRKQATCNYVKKYIEFCSYDSADRALDLGCDPAIKVNGRNALDAAVIYIHKNPSEELKRHVLVRKLTQFHNLSISNTLQNLIWFCERNQIANALAVLRSCEIDLDTRTDMFGYIFTSPVQVD